MSSPKSGSGSPQISTNRETVRGPICSSSAAWSRLVVTTTDLDRIVLAAKDIAAREGAQAARLLKGELLRTQLDLATYLARRDADPNHTFREHLKSFGGAIEI